MTTTPSDYFFFFFNDTATTEIYTLSLHDALPISLLLFEENAFNLRAVVLQGEIDVAGLRFAAVGDFALNEEDRKSTRLNSSHLVISYAVFCLKKKNTFDLSNCLQIPINVVPITWH